MQYTPLKRVKDAIRFVQTQITSAWMILGQTDPWDTPYSDTDPPPVGNDDIEIPQAFVAVKVTNAFWCYEDNSGTFTVIDSFNAIRKFVQVNDPAVVIANQYTNVFLEALINSIDLMNLGVSSFRAAGIATDVVPIAGHESDVILPAAYVDSWGDLEIIDYRQPVFLGPSGTYDLSMVLQY